MARLTPQQWNLRIDRRLREIDRTQVRVMNLTMDVLRRRTIQRHLSGPTTRTSIRKQSRDLIRSIKIDRAKRDPNSTPGLKGASASIRFTVPYAKVHIGIRGHRTTIRPVRRSKLAIPTRFARRKNGVPFAPPRSPRWGNTFVRNDIIFGTPGRSGTLRPLFVLRDSVTVPQRIDIQEDLVAPANRIYQRLIRPEVTRILGGA